MRTILNIHGYGGSAHNSAYTALRSLDCHVISPQLDYAAESPVQTLETLRNIVKEGEVDALAGTSFGGFFAALLCTEFRLPAMLVNPCLLPFDVLPRFGYPQPIQPLMALFGRLAAWNSSLVHCIIGGADEVIGDHAFTKRLLNHAALQIVPDGKHSGATLPLPSFFQTALAETAELHPMQVQIASRRESEAISLPEHSRETLPLSASMTLPPGKSTRRIPVWITAGCAITCSIVNWMIWIWMFWNGVASLTRRIFRRRMIWQNSF